MPYNEETLNLAQQFLSESFHANMGGTEILSALKSAVHHRMIGQDVTTEIIVLTDGEVWNVDSTIDFVRRTREK